MSELLRLGSLGVRAALLSPEELSDLESDLHSITGKESPFIEAEQRKYRVPKTTSGKIGRNEKCPCGSGLKYKKCCLIKSR